jgi:hypothetical protein
MVGMVLGQLALSDEQRDAVKQALEEMIRARAGGRGPAVLTSPINLGIGMK